MVTSYIVSRTYITKHSLTL